MPIKQRRKKNSFNGQQAAKKTKRKYELIDPRTMEVIPHELKSPAGKKPIELTDEIRKTIVDLIRAGNFVDTAVRAAGISTDTLKRWLAKVSHENIKKIKTEKEWKKIEPYYRLMLEVQQAASLAEAGRVQLIHECAEAGQWQAAAWFLERKFPDRWGKKNTVHHQVEGEVKHSGEVTQRILKDPDLTQKALDIFDATVVAEEDELPVLPA